MRTCRNLMFVFVALFALAAHADGIDALTHFYDNVDSLSAHFEQTQKAEDGAVLRQSSGLFLLSRPGQFRWEYKNPYQQIMVSDGEEFQFYDVDLAQVTIRQVTDTLQATPALLLTGGIALQKAFAVHDAGNHDGLVWLRMEPRSQDSDFEAIRIGLSDGLPRAMELDDRLGQTTYIKFSDIKVNPQLDPARFDLDIPDGVTVVDGRNQKQ